jgi:hypothetical protein
MIHAMQAARCAGSGDRECVVGSKQDWLKEAGIAFCD